MNTTLEFAPLLLDAGQGGTFIFLIKVLINAIAVFLGARFLTGVQIDDFVKAIVVALVLALLNSTLGAVLDFITTPLRWLTLGLFSFIVDGIVIMIADYFMKSFNVKNFWWAIGLAIIIALTNMVLGPILM